LREHGPHQLGDRMTVRPVDGAAVRLPQAVADRPHAPFPGPSPLHGARICALVLESFASQCVVSSTASTAACLAAGVTWYASSLSSFSVTRGIRSCAGSRRDGTPPPWRTPST